MQHEASPTTEPPPLSGVAAESVKCDHCGRVGQLAAGRIAPDGWSYAFGQNVSKSGYLYACSPKCWPHSLDPERRSYHIQVGDVVNLGQGWEMVHGWYGDTGPDSLGELKIYLRGLDPRPPILH